MDVDVHISSRFHVRINDFNFVMNKNEMIMKEKDSFKKEEENSLTKFQQWIFSKIRHKNGMNALHLACTRY